MSAREAGDVDTELRRLRAALVEAHSNLQAAEQVLRPYRESWEAARDAWNRAIDKARPGPGATVQAIRDFNVRLKTIQNGG